MSTVDSIISVRKNVIEKFNELKSALTMREKLLLRQLDVINNARKRQQQHEQHLININIEPKKSYSPSESVLTTLPSSPSLSSQSVISNNDIQFLCDNETELFENIRNYGRYQITTNNMTNLILQDLLHLKHEDYIIPSNDHEIFYKDLVKQQIDENKESPELFETVMVDFSQQKLIMEDTAKKMNESIINITLSEAKELIKKAKLRKEYAVPPLNLEELDDNVESSVADVISSLTVSESFNQSEHETNLFKNYKNTNNNNNNDGSTYNNKYSQTQKNMFQNEEKRFKPKITINNCNGTINLRNIAALTINCTTEDNVQTKLFDNKKNKATIASKETQHRTSDIHKKTRKKPFHQSSLPIVKINKNNSNNIIDCNISSTTINNGSTDSNTSTITTTPISVTTSTNNDNLCSQYKTVQQQPQQNRFLKPNNEATKRQDNIDYQLATSQETSTSDGQTCDFYNRLLNEIKKTIKQNQYKYQIEKTNIRQSEQKQQMNELIDSHTNESVLEYPKRFVLKNFANLRIILEARNSVNDETLHPVQIEQWLADIIADTDLEPMQNTDILEYSKIHAERQKHLPAMEKLKEKSPTD